MKKENLNEAAKIHEELSALQRRFYGDDENDIKVSVKLKICDKYDNSIPYHQSLEEPFLLSEEEIDNIREMIAARIEKAIKDKVKRLEKRVEEL